MRARYDLSRRNISFDYYAWQAHAVLLGAEEIVFKISDGFGRHREPDHTLQRRYHSIIRPGPDMLGLPWREGDDGEEMASHYLHHIIGLGRWDFPRLKTVLPAGQARYTVTIRNVPTHPARNSPPVMRKFAHLIGAHVIEDFHDRPIDLHERMAIYAGAKMNFGSVNGPMGMLMLSGYPLQMWGCNACADRWAKHGIERGKQVPWFMPGQSLVWETPTLDAMMAGVNRIERGT
jgi:hypothetical protein